MEKGLNDDPVGHPGHSIVHPIGHPIQRLNYDPIGHPGTERCIGHPGHSRDQFVQFADICECSLPHFFQLGLGG